MNASRPSRLNVRPCSACMFMFRADRSQCPNCGLWNRDGAESRKENPENRIKKASEVEKEKGGRKGLETITTGIADKAFSKYGGIVTTGSYLIAGAPGGGKSTLCLKIVEGASRTTKREGLYLCLEQAEDELVEMALEMKVDLDTFWIYPMGCEDEIGSVVAQYKPSIVIVDSIVKLSGHDERDAVNVCAALKRIARLTKTPFVIINHVTKSQAQAGLNALQHEVDWTGTMFPIEPKDGRSIQAEPPRELEWFKNRFGGQRITHFEMNEPGGKERRMHEVELSWMKEGGKEERQIPEFEGEGEEETDEL